MKKEIEINGKKYKPAEITFGNYADMSEMGADIGDPTKNLTNIRAYVAITVGVDKKEAGDIIQEHIVSGGSMKEISDCLADAIGESDFFQHLLGLPDTQKE